MTIRGRSPLNRRSRCRKRRSTGCGGDGKAENRGWERWTKSEPQHFFTTFSVSDDFYLPSRSLLASLDAAGRSP